MKKGIYLLLIVCCIACTNSNKKTTETTSETIQHIDISGLRFPDGKLLLSDAADDIEIIPLETTDKSIFDGKKIRNIVADQENIFINVSRRILHFNRKGKYIKDIGRFGQGPADFMYSTGIGLDESGKTLYVASNMSVENKLVSYSYAGKHINTIQIAKEGAWLSGNTNHRELRDYCFVNGQHIIRRRLPLPDPTKENWQIMIKDTTNGLVAEIYDPSILEYQTDFKKNSGTELNRVNTYWEAFAPVMNRYDNQITFLFEANDTLYGYNQATQQLSPRYIVYCANRLSFEETHVMDKSSKYFDTFIQLKDLLETRDFLYLVAEKEKYAYLLRVDKKSGEIQSKRREGEIKFAPIMQIHYRDVPEPEFTNDLCGGLSFYPDHHNAKEWIGVYNPEDLLENIDTNELEETDVVLPEKRNRLLEVIKKLKEDDNPVLMIVKLR